MSEPLEDHKYVVFNRQQWERWRRSWMTHDARSAMPSPIDDAVVIRRQDVFAPPALDAYANSITVAIEVAGRSDEAVAAGFPTRMKRISDYFHEQAKASWETHRKIPD